MGVMDLRRRLLMQMLGGGDVAQSKSGSFAGDGTITTVLDIGFEPDVIVVESGLDISVAGFQGVILVAIVKGVMTFNYYHNSATDTSVRTMNDFIRPNQDAWGADSGAYRNYALYSDGKLTVTNKTNNSNFVFINGQTYNWTAYKA